MEIKHKSYLKCDNNPCVCESIIKQVLQEATVEQQNIMELENIIKEQLVKFDEEFCEQTFTDPHKRLRQEVKYFLTSSLTQAFIEGEKFGATQERQFILNVLDGIDIADKQIGNNKELGTKAIRFVLSTRYIPNKSDMRKVQVLSADHAQSIPIKIKNNPHGSAGAPLSEENFRGPAGESYTLGIDMALGASDRTVVQTLTPKFCSKCDATVYLDDARECSNCLRTFCMSHCGSGPDGKTYCKACWRLKFEN